jgi:probable HAF family extracellular repeat protein
MHYCRDITKGVELRDVAFRIPRAFTFWEIDMSKQTESPVATIRLKTIAAALITAGLTSLPLTVAARADTVGLGNLSGSSTGHSTASVLNGAGQVAGNSNYYVGGIPQGQRAFLWSNGTMTNLGTLSTDASGNGASYAQTLNNAGQVAGSYEYYVGGTFLGQRAFLWSNGTMTNLGDLGTIASGWGSSIATALNSAGQVAGVSNYVVGGTDQGGRAFLWSNGIMTNLGSLGTEASGYGYSTATALNSAGQVAGVSGYFVGGTSQGQRAFLWSNGTMNNLGSLGTDASGGGSSTATALNNAGQVAGNSYYYVGGMYQGQHAFLWSNGTMTDLGTLGTNAGGVGTSFAHALNNVGQVAGESEYFVGGTDQGYRAFLWSNGTMTNLGSFGGNSSASALNDTGQVVGYSNTSSGAQHAFLYNAGTMHDLNTFAPTGWAFKNAIAINAFGQVAGNGTHNGYGEAFLFTPHPDWQGGNGYWDDTGRWNYSGMGAFGFAPGAPHDVLINPTGSATVFGSNNATVRSLTITGNANQVVTLNLNSGSTTTTNGATLDANGIIAGSGRLSGGLTTAQGSRIQVNGGESQQYAGGSLVTNGEVRMLGTAANPASLESAGSATNNVSGRYNLQNANLSVNGGLANYGQINASYGNSTIGGAVTNYNGGKIILSGNSNTTFYDAVDVKSGGELRVSAGSTATFFSQVSQRTGALFTGTGSKFFEGGLSIGGSPGLGTDAGSVSFGAGNLYLEEIGGVTACTAACETNDAFRDSSFDKYVVAGNLTFGGTLKLVSWNSYTAKAGDRFDIFDWGSTSGQFDSIDSSGLLLAAGTRLDTSRLYVDGSFSVAAVPEPETYAMFLAGLGMLGAVVRRRRVGVLGRGFGSFGDQVVAHLIA